MKHCLAIGVFVGDELEGTEDCTVIGSADVNGIDFADAFAAFFGVYPVRRGKTKAAGASKAKGPLLGADGRILLQMGADCFDMEKVLKAAKARRDALKAGAAPYDIIKDRAAAKRIQAVAGKAPQK